MDPVTNVKTMENSSMVGIPSMNSLVTLKSPSVLWSENWFGLTVEFVVLGLFLLICSHASRKGERAIYMLVTLMVATTGIELLQQIPHDGYELWWYHESAVNLFHHKVPLYILCLFSLIYYCVDSAMEDVHLPLLTKSLASAVASMSVAFPLLRLAPNYLLMMVHFDDPVFIDRLGNVSYSEMTYLFLLFFHVGHLYNGFFDEIDVQDRHFLRFFRCSLLSGAVSAIYSLIEFYLLYVAIKLIFHMNAGFCLASSFVVLCFLAKDEIADKVKEISSHDVKTVLKKKEWLYVVSFFLLITFLPVMVHPEDLKSNGERLELGPCQIIHSVSNMSPLDSFRKRYICTNSTGEFGFDFHCVPERDLSTSKIKKQYTICGAPFSDLAQLMKSMVLYTTASLGLFYYLLSLKVTLRDIPPKAKKID